MGIPSKRSFTVGGIVRVNKKLASFPWFRLRLPSCGPGFEYQAHHLCFFQFVLLKLYRENNENKQKEAGIGPFLKKTSIYIKKVVVAKLADRLPPTQEDQGKILAVSNF